MPQQRCNEGDERFGDVQSEGIVLSSCQIGGHEKTDFLYRIGFTRFRGFRGICKETHVMLCQSQTGEKREQSLKLTWKGGRADTVCTRGVDMNFAVREISLDYIR